MFRRRPRRLDKSACDSTHLLMVPTVHVSGGMPLHRWAVSRRTRIVSTDVVVPATRSRDGDAVPRRHVGTFDVRTTVAQRQDTRPTLPSGRIQARRPDRRPGRSRDCAAPGSDPGTPHRRSAPAIAGKSAHRLALRVRDAGVRIDGRKLAPLAVLHAFEFHRADADAPPAVLGKRRGATDNEIGPEPAHGRRCGGAGVQVVERTLPDDENRESSRQSSLRLRGGCSPDRAGA